MGGGDWQNWSWYFNFAVTIALIAHLVFNGLFRVYRCFFAYLVANAIESAVGLLVRSSQPWYGNVYLGGETVKMMLAILVVLKLYQLALEKHPALSRFGRNTVAYILLAAAAGAMLVAQLDRVIPQGRSAILHRFLTFERTMDFWMLLFLGIVSLFMVWFPVRLKRNGVLYIGGFVTYFLSQSAGLLLMNLTPRLNRPLNAAMLAVSSVCLLVWLFALTRRGEEVTAVVGHGWNREETARLTAQLDAINTRLLHLSRR